MFMQDISNRSSLLVSAGAGDSKIYVTDCETAMPIKAMAGHSGKDEPQREEIRTLYSENSIIVTFFITTNSLHQLYDLNSLQQKFSYTSNYLGTNSVIVKRVDFLFIVTPCYSHCGSL